MLNSFGSNTPSYATSKRFLLDSLAHKAISNEAAAALNALTSPVLITDIDYTIIFANRCSHELAAQLRIQPLVGASLADFYSHSDCLHHSFVLHVMPLRDARGDCTGAFVDWCRASGTDTHLKLDKAFCLNA